MIGWIVDIAGWVGAVALLGAYAALSSGRLRAEGPAYHGLNVAGSVLLLINAAYHGALPSTAVNVVWIGIGGAALLRARATSGDTR